MSEIFIKNFVPIEIKPQYNFANTIVFFHPSMESLALNYIANNENSRKGTIIWEKFPDGQPNIKFEKLSQLENKRIIFFMNLHDSTILFEQLSILKILPRQLIQSLDIYICYYSVGTMERVDEEGILATADTMANIISNCMELTKEGKPIIHIYDIHALQNRFYFDYTKVQIKLESGIPLLINKINSDSIIVFPDDGAYKRFGKSFSLFKTIICSKVRLGDGDQRLITIKDMINFPLDKTNLKYSEVIIVDDLVQSGNTLIECKNALETLGYSNISAYVTHSVFPNDSWKKIISNGFKRFYTTNSNPDTISKFENIPKSPFVILKLFGEQLYNPIKIFVSSHNIQKLQAGYNTFIKQFKHHNFEIKGINVESGVPPQPIGYGQTKTGSLNRLNNMIKFLDDKLIYWDYSFSYENGIVGVESSALDNSYWKDICHLTIKDKNSDLICNKYSQNIVEIPDEYYNICVRYNQTRTIGEIIQEQTGIPKNSFHEFFNEEKKTRIDIMSNITFDI